MKKKKTNNTNTEGVPLYEELLIFAALRYCIGRHTYIVSLAGDIGKNYYNKLSDDQKEHFSTDIRRQIRQQLEYMPYNFSYDGIYGDCNPIEDFVTACHECGITSLEELGKRKKIICYYDYELEVKRYEDFIVKYGKNHTYSLDIDDLLPFENLASLFDVKNHLIVTATNGKEYECFVGYQKKLVEDENMKGMFRYAPFGWEKMYVPVDSYLQNGNNHSYIIPEMIDKIEKKNNEEKQH